MVSGLGPQAVLGPVFLIEFLPFGGHLAALEAGDQSLGKVAGVTEMTKGEVCSDDDKICKMGF